jgi:formylglycine-generating enzyme required for sulfatase activity/serine/threonine protein kinase
MDRFEVLKVMSKALVGQPAAVDRFMQEIRSAGRLSHPNVAMAHSAHQLDDLLVLAMEYVEGEDLAKVVRTRGPLPIQNACYCVHQAATALQRGYELGLVHRDIKPGNILLSRQGKRQVVKVIDFGLAKAKSEVTSGQELTGTNQMMGTPGYTAPEQLKDAKNADARSDIYSLGCTLYCLLSGEPPFQGNTAYAVLLAQHAGEIRPLREIRPEVPEALEAVVAKMMAVEPAERFGQPGEVAAALVPFIKGAKESAEGSGEVPRSGTKPARPELSAVPDRRNAKDASERSQPPAEPAAALQRSVPPGKPALAGSIRKSTPAARPAHLEKVPKTKAKRRSRMPGAWLIAAAVVLLGGLLAVPLVLRVRTTQGTLELTLDPPDAEVLVDGDEVTVKRRGGEPVVIRGVPGKRTLHVQKGGFEAQSPDITLVEGNKQELTIRLVPKPADNSGRDREAAHHAVQPEKAVTKGTTNTPKPVAPLVRERPAPLDCTGPSGVSATDVRKSQEAWAKYLGRQVEETVAIGDGVTITFVLVPPGKFLMGSPDGDGNGAKSVPLHTVVLTEPFDLGKYEVTQRQYQALTGKNPSTFTENGSDRPVERVSWEEAEDFGRELTKRRNDNHVYRLPTEAEWEYSCRGGRPTSQLFGIGDGRSLSSFEANINGAFPFGTAKEGPNLEATCKVGSYKPNALGLFDMHGNVWEWCADFFGPYPAGEVTNPTGPTDSSGADCRVVRGGAWLAYEGNGRSSDRLSYTPNFQYKDLGFRLARSVASRSK